MLARIIHERGLAGTSLGTLALTAGAVDDAGGLVHPGRSCWPASAAAWGGAYAGDRRRRGLRALHGVRRLAPAQRRSAAHVAARARRSSSSLLAVVLVLFCLSAFAMDAIGIHAVFGGFLLGAVHAARRARPRSCARSSQPFVVVFLLPMFFTYSGLNTRLAVVIRARHHARSRSRILAASFCGKGIACWAAARMSGESNRDALAIGSLMNARGLMELIIINIGLQAGVIRPGAVLDPGADGDRHDADGHAAVQLGDARAARRGRRSAGLAAACPTGQ